MSAEQFRVPPASAPPGDAVDNDRTVVSAVFDDSQSAQSAITELRQMAIPAEDISLISRHGDNPAATQKSPTNEDAPALQDQTRLADTPVVFESEVPPDEPLGGSRQLGLKTDASIADKTPGTPMEEMAAEVDEERMGGAVIGAGLGSVAGLLAGIAALAIPGLGPVLAAGPLATALGGMLAGGAVGGIIGALATVGVPEEYAREYATSIEQGSTLVTVHTDPLGRDAVERVLVAHGGRDVH